MQIEDTALEGVKILRPRRFEDARGFFCEVWNRDVLARAGIVMDFVQDNHSLSRSTGTVRGLHFQAPPRAQDKLVRAGAGTVFDVAVDIRRGSPSYGKWLGVELSAENGLQLLIPKGFLHGFVTRTPDAELLYKCTDSYAPDCDGAVYFASPEIGIDWGIAEDAAILSDKDRAATRFADFQSPFVFEG
ncbi:dTDP-4-dehydrorhamnose 3,5-epimerase [Fertoebacter nigrum]|uniref:dTDP-4-dehydrorhamnose 3,5-epimerase n=1 Tax=Fertoeibacter niger TaxID=2656921 RepID=A0A8X8KSH9_9RHOB|nr:dTDP-4-dehydrorhamnose 3,5-epimerase [Fertoeibacter niger]NUB46507.1 dTDP-4-dehydrorhamnose 3,5-epimerase [Fertoeibacter niger]